MALGEIYIPRISVSPSFHVTKLINTGFESFPPSFPVLVTIPVFQDKDSDPPLPSSQHSPGALLVLGTEKGRVHADPHLRAGVGQEVDSGETQDKIISSEMLL